MEMVFGVGVADEIQHGIADGDQYGFTCWTPFIMVGKWHAGCLRLQRQQYQHLEGHIDREHTYVVDVDKGILWRETNKQTQFRL